MKMIDVVGRRILTLLALIALSLAASADDRPNILLAIGDDISWQGLGCYFHSRCCSVWSVGSDATKFEEPNKTAMINPRPAPKLTHEDISTIIISVYPRPRSGMTCL